LGIVVEGVGLAGGVGDFFELVDEVVLVANGVSSAVVMLWGLAWLSA
jgi:hypothetical protein